MGFELIAVICGAVFWMTGSTAQYVDERKHPEKYEALVAKKKKDQKKWDHYWGRGSKKR